MEFGRKMSPETASPVFPDRLIHPLPKRRLRERLSSDAADLIKYPPAHTPGTPLFYYPYSLKHDAAPAERTIVVGRANLASPTVKPTTTTTAATPAAMAARPGQATNQATRHPSRARRSSSEDESLSPSRTVRHVNRSGRAAQPLHMPPPESHRTIPSTASSVDGYESFENTNNKKKRKIPTAGDTSHGGSYSSTDIHSATSVSSTTNSSDDSLIGSPQSTTYSGPASFVSTSSGISGPGRGRYGRSRSGRSPLHPLTDAGSNWVGRYGKLRLPWPVQPELDAIFPASSNAGIISSAIANAERQEPQGQENTGLPTQDQQSAASTPASAQFTFTCSSQVPGNLLWPGSDPKMPPSSSYWQQGRIRGGMGSQSSSVPVTTSNASSAGGRSSRIVDSSRTKQQSEKEKERRKERHELKKQARDRRRRQQEQNAAHPPEGELYICQYCEYERVTGRKSRLKIEYEQKERMKRLDMERRQREKRSKDRSKNRNRKGRKTSKAGTSSTSTNVLQGSLPDDTGQGTGGDDAYEEDDIGEEDDDPIGDPRTGIGNVINTRAGSRAVERVQVSLAGG